MSIVHIVAVLAVMQFILFGLLVGKAREQHGIKAPAVSGNEEFERIYRVQMNTLEQLVCFLPFVEESFFQVCKRPSDLV